MPRRWSGVALATILFLAAACGEPGSDPGPEAPPDEGAPTASQETVPEASPETVPEAAREDSVRVWFEAGGTMVPVVRTAAATPRGALEALLAGPTSAEAEGGLSSWFGTETVGVLREVRRDSGRWVVSFDPSLPRRIPGAATSAGSRALLSALDSTLFQFEEVQAVEYRLGASCPAFWEWLQRECQVVRR